MHSTLTNLPNDRKIDPFLQGPETGLRELLILLIDTKEALMVARFSYCFFSVYHTQKPILVNCTLAFFVHSLNPVFAGMKMTPYGAPGKRRALSAGCLALCLNVYMCHRHCMAISGDTNLPHPRHFCKKSESTQNGLD